MPGLLGGRSDVESRGAECQPGYPTTPLHSGSRFVGHQQSKGNKYQVEVVFKVSYSQARTQGHIPEIRHVHVLAQEKDRPYQINKVLIKMLGTILTRYFK